MTTNEEFIRKLYQVAEVKDVPGFIKLFTDDGYFYDVSAGQKYYGQDIGKTVDVYARAFPDMHRELYNLYTSGNRVIVELSLNGTHKGPLELPAGTIQATGKEIHAPCCDVFLIENGKVKSFHCYTAATILLGQLGVLANLSGSFSK